MTDSDIFKKEINLFEALIFGKKIRIQYFALELA
jgi:hypothetical protein